MVFAEISTRRRSGLQAGEAVETFGKNI